MAKIKQDFEMYQGEDKLLTFAITDDADDPADLTSSTATWMLAHKLALTNTVLTKITTDGIVINGSNYEVTLLPSDTVGIEAGEFYHELRMVDSDGKESVVATGSATIRPSITKT